MGKVLIYRRGGLGDTLLLFPVFEILSRRGFEVHAVGNTDYLKIAKSIGWIKRAFSEIPEGEYPVRFVFSEGNLPPFPQGRVWVVEHYLRSVGLSGEFSRRLPLRTSENSPLKGKVVLHPSSGSPKKNPPLELFFELEKVLKERGAQVVYPLGEAEGWLEGKVERSYPIRDLLRFARDLASATAYIGVDSGISHLASYLGVRSLVIYGPTDPLVWGPIGYETEVINVPMECSPCFPHVCSCRACLSAEKLLELILPRLDHLLV